MKYPSPLGSDIFFCLSGEAMETISRDNSSNWYPYYIGRYMI